MPASLLKPRLPPSAASDYNAIMTQPARQPATPPRTSTKLCSAALWLLTILGVASYIGYGGLVGDELMLLADARRVLAGELPYRDFWAHITPLSYWLPAWTYLVVGPSLLAARVVAALALGAGAWMIARAARDLGAGPWTALLPALGLVWALYRIWPVYNHHWLALTMVVGALSAAGHGLVTRAPVAWLLAGLATALTILTVQSDGAILAIALACSLVLAVLCLPRNGRPWARDAGWLTAGVALPLALAALYFAAEGALGAALYYNWVWPLQQYKSAGGVNDIAYATDLPQLLLPVTQLPFWYGRVYHFVFLFALLPGAALGSCLWGLALFGRRLRTGPGWSPAEARAVPWAFTAVGFFVLATRGRADFIHAALFAAPALVLAAAGASWLSARLAPPAGAGWLRWLPQALIAGFVATGAFMHVREMTQAPGTWLSLESPDARLARLPSVTYLREHARPGDQVAAMPMGGLYYMYGLPPAVSASLLIPPEGRYMSEADFTRYWAEIEARRPRFLVIVPYLAGRQDLEAFLRAPARHYQRVATFQGSEFPGTPTHIYERRAEGR